MQAPTQANINNFDLLRIAAALQVVLGHGFVHLNLAKPFWWPLVEAFPGVPIFFVISGYLISKSYERSSSLAGYARNRALRIFPALWACIALTIVAASFAGFSFFNAQALAWVPAQMAGLIYTPAFLQTFGFGSYNGSLWTIPLELQFYIVLPAVYWLLPRRQGARDAGFALLLALFTVLALAYTLHAVPIVEGQPEPIAQKVFRYTFVPHFYLFLAGVLLQRLRLERSPLIAGKGLLWIAAYLVFHFGLPRNAWTDIAGTLIMAFCVVSVAYTRRGLSESLLHGNDVSYGVYIYHGLLINVFLTLGWQGHAALMPLLLALTLAVSFASWKLIEKPCLGRKRASGSVTVRAAPAAASPHG